MKLVDRKGKAHKVDIGLVDKGGAFFLLLDDDEPTFYLRFSDESELITSQAEEIKRLRGEVEHLRQRVSGEGLEVAQDGTVSIGCAAMLLGFGKSYTRKIISAHKLGHVKRDGQYAVPLSAIEYFQKGKGHPDA